MAALTFTQRKTVNVHWTDEIKGGSVSIQANSPAWEEPKEVRNTTNDGYATITFPADFTGECEVVVSGSHGGEETGTVTVQ
ncbi:MAG TPA: hypothetical protein VNM39_02005 [Verrucomicrobiae bacterium]|nr:hypothetical protein [Verrucomicrobiae bacterium]